MLNVLGHFGVQGFLSRVPFRRVDVRWILLGSVLPAASWLASRVVPAFDVHNLRLYSVALASLPATLLLAGALAALAPRARLVFGVLAFNAIVHLLLEACPTRWGGGVAFGAPFSWNFVSFDLFWPESWIPRVAVAVGVAFLAWVWRKGLWAPFRLTWRRWPLVLLLLAAWVAAPLPMIAGAYEANVHDAKTLRNQRVGQPVTFDAEEFDGVLKPWDKERYRLWPAPAERGVVSLRGVLAVPNEIVVEEIHVHGEVRHDYGSWAGLFLLAASLSVGLWRGRRQPSEY